MPHNNNSNDIDEEQPQYNNYNNTEDEEETDLKKTDSKTITMALSEDPLIQGATTTASNDNDDDDSYLRTLRWINLAAYIFNVVMTYGLGVAGFLPNTKTNAEVSAKYPTLVTPAGWAFAIWSLIFLTQGLWVVLPFFWSSSSAWVLQTVSYKYVYIVLFQALWTLCFSREWIGASAVLMTGLCGVLWWTVLALLYSQDYNATWRSYIFWIWPFALHTGWITAATAVNWNLWLVFAGAGTNVQFLAAFVSLLVLFAVSLALICLKVDKTVPLVVVWAFLAVAVELGNPPDAIVDHFEPTQIKRAKRASFVLAALTMLLAIVIR